MPVKKLLEYITLCVEKVFDTCSLDWKVFDLHKAKIEALVNEKGWRIEPHTLTMAIFKDKVGLKLVFGEKPDKKTMRELIKEQKQHGTR